MLATFGALLALTLAAAGLASWGAQRSSYHLERSRLAHTVLEAHLNLSADTYELFKQVSDSILIGESGIMADEADARQRFKGTVSNLRYAIAAEVAHVEGADDRDDEVDEIDQLAEIERQIARALDGFQGVNDLTAQGRHDEARAALKSVLDERIDREFASLIETAVDGERAEVAEADAAAARLLARVDLAAKLMAVAAVAVIAVAGAVLVRRLRRPLDDLSAGALALADGDLGHRVAIGGSDEFARLAHTFNRMAERLQHQQQALNEARNTLEHKVAERTSEVEAASQALVTADRNRRRFLADISHELRTPLTVIRGEAEVALRGGDKDTEDYKVTLQRIVDQARHTATLVDDLLFVARAETGETRLQMRAVGLDEVIERACADAEILGRDKSIVVESRLDVRDVTVSGDAGRLRQVFMILLDNAVRYSQPHGLVTVTLSPSPDGFIVRVSDEGVGIAPEEVDRVFERFYRGANAAVVHGEGSGLGLPVAKAIVEAHGGQIAVDSVLDRGTTISVSLPSLRRLRAVQ
jgi:signal transduction histidine kinase